MNKNNNDLRSNHHFRIYSFLVIFFLLTSFCNKTTLSLTKDTIETASYESKTKSYLIGYYEFGQVEEWVCPPGSHNKVVIERNMYDSLIHFAIGGIYTTRTNNVYCSKSLEVAEIEPETKNKAKRKK